MEMSFESTKKFYIKTKIYINFTFMCILLYIDLI